MDIWNFGSRAIVAMVTGIVLAAVPLIAEMQESKFTAQSPAPTQKFSRPTFDKVSIRESKFSKNQHSMQTVGNGINFKDAPLIDIIIWAFRPQEHWDLYKPGNDLDTRYDITAEGPPGIKPELMVRSLLEDIFKLKVHHELRLAPIYNLVISKGGPKLTPSSSGGSKVSQVNNVAVFTHASMEMLCEFLKEERDVPVFDQTGLKGFYDFTLKLPPPPPVETPLGELYTSMVQPYVNIKNQIGLELKSGKMRMDFIVLDHVEKLPQK